MKISTGRFVGVAFIVAALACSTAQAASSNNANPLWWQNAAAEALIHYARMGEPFSKLPQRYQQVVAVLHENNPAAEESAILAKMSAGERAAIRKVVSDPSLGSKIGLKGEQLQELDRRLAQKNSIFGLDKGSKLKSQYLQPHLDCLKTILRDSAQRDFGCRQEGAGKPGNAGGTPPPAPAENITGRPATEVHPSGPSPTDRGAGALQIRPNDQHKDDKPKEKPGFFKMLGNAIGTLATGLFRTIGRVAEALFKGIGGVLKALFS